jgi:DeoR family transcriptional regulator, suf operon transcriptional repressor
MKSTRERILQALLVHPRSTITNLAGEVGINDISVRHHISTLLIQGLIRAEEERHGIGRPRQVFSLTEAGSEMFPTNYLKLTTKILDQMKNSMPAQVVEKLFTEIALEMSANYKQLAEKMTLEEKLNLIQNLLSREGFTVDWERSGDEYRINEISCPYLHVGQNHPEVCTVDKTLIATILSTPVEKINCVLLGNDHCTYVIKNPAHSGKTI